LEKIKDIALVVAQSLLWSAIDQTYEGIFMYINFLLASETQEHTEVLLNAIVVLFACPDITLIEKYVIEIVSACQSKIENRNIVEIFSEPDFWIILVYFGLNSTSDKVTESCHPILLYY
jgi:hypothetical protein